MPWIFGRRAKASTVIMPTEPRRFFWLGGRRHMANTPYVLPSDDQEVNRLDFQHYMLRYALRGNYAAPIQQPASILDVGSGTGRWGLEMARLFPQAKVVATDLVEPAGGAGFDQQGGPPPNYSFVRGNVLERLPFADNSFDYVHVRLLLFAIPAEQWPAVAREVVRVTKPGGWIESVETGPQTNGGPAMDQLVRWITQASLRRGVDPLLGPRIAQFYTQAGMTNLTTRQISLPVGKYGGRLGGMAEVDVFGVVAGVKPLIVAQNIADGQAYDTALAQAKADLDRWRCTLPFYIAIGRKG